MVPDPFAARFCREFPAGAVIFRETEAGERMYVIQRGRVRLSRRFVSGERTLATLGAGEFFGEMAILNDRPRSATAVAVDDVQVMELDARTLEGMMARSGEVAMRLVRRLAMRVESSNSFVEILMQSDPRARVVLAIARVAEESGERVPEGLRVPGGVASLAEELGLPVEIVTEVIAGLLRVRVLLSDAEGRWIVSQPQRLRTFVELLGSAAARRD